MTSEEIVKALRQCAKSDCSSCGICPIFSDRECVEHLATAAANLIEQLIDENTELREEVNLRGNAVRTYEKKRAKAEAERDALREKQRWILVTERPPEERVLVNVVWVNRAPEPYYERIKNVPFSGTACFYRGNWYWDSPVVLDLLAEYGEDAFDLVDEAVEITHWRPLPEAPEEGEKA